MDNQPTQSSVDSSSDSISAFRRNLYAIDERNAQDFREFCQQLNAPKSDSSSEDDDEDDSDHGEYIDEVPILTGHLDETIAMEVDDEDYEDDEDDDEFDDNINLTSNDYSRSDTLSELEAILLVLMNQVHFDQSDEEAQQFACGINAARKVIECTTYKTMKSNVPNAFDPVISKYFYTECGESHFKGLTALVGPVTDLDKPTQSCSDNHAGCVIQDPSAQIMKDGSYFCSIRLSEWLQHLVAMWFDKLRLPKQNIRNPGIYHDLADCEEYQKLVVCPGSYKDDDFTDTLTITLAWDGADFSKKGTQSLWPLVAYLNELPFQDRINNPMLVALHAGTQKPKNDLMLMPLIDELIALAHEPLRITANGNEYRFFVKLHLFLADGPARAVLLNCHGHSGCFGCHLCDTEFRQTKFGAPEFYTTSIFDLNKRRNEEWRKTALSVPKKEDAHIRGIKGTCQLMRLPYIDLAHILPPEPLHSMYLGNVKAILKRWLGQDIADKEWFKILDEGQKKKYRRNHLVGIQNRVAIIKEIDSRFALIKFPEKVLRPMPKLSLGLSKLRSLEYENILFYGWPCLEGLIKPDSFSNFKQLAFILTELTSKEIHKRTRMRLVKQEVDKFFKSFDRIYGHSNPDGTMVGIEPFMWRLNVHYLAHLCEMVELYGPLNVQAAYFTESTIGEVVRKVMTGTSIPQQVTNKFILQYSVWSVCRQLIKSCSKPFLERLNYYNRNLFSVPIAQESSHVSIPTQSFSTSHTLSIDEMNALGNRIKPDQSFNSLQRVKWNGKVICTESHNLTRAKKTINHCLRIMNKCASTVKYFIIKHILQECDTKQIFFLGNELKNCVKVPLYNDSGRKITNLTFSHISTYSGVSDSLIVLDSASFCDLATYATINNKDYVFDVLSNHS